MGTEFLSDYILNNFEVHEWKHAAQLQPMQPRKHAAQRRS